MLKVQCEMCKSLHDYELGIVSVMDGNGFVYFTCSGCKGHMVLMQPKEQNIHTRPTALSTPKEIE